MKAYNKIIKKQRGAALLLIIMVLFVSISTMILATANNEAPQLQRQAEVRNQLNLAKEMLLAYAMQYPDISGSSNGPGRLPCPDVDNNAFPDASCSSTVATFQGRLPQSLDPAGAVKLTFNNTYVNLDQQFWYAVDPNFHWSASAPINSNSPGSGSFSLDGAGDIVAVLIAPGEAVADQDRSSSTVADSNYLDGSNPLGSTYYSNYAGDPASPDKEDFNDQFVTISHSELMTMASYRVTQEIKKELDSYYSSSRYYRNSIPSNPFATCNSPYYWGKTYPRNYTYRGDYYYAWSGSSWSPVCTWETEDVMFDDAMSDAVAWYATDDWDLITTYTNISNTQATVVFSGCDITFTFSYDTSAGESNITRTDPNLPGC
tara:strand:- start:79386 stop:80507 length:1122 start_codon:yes stop_codon:yes gene_type:complete